MTLANRTYYLIQVSGGKQWITSPARGSERLSSSRPPHLYSSESDARGALKQLERVLGRDDLELKPVVVWEHVKLLAE